MNDKELRALVERMVADLMGQAPTPQVKGSDYHPMEPGPAAEGGELQDIAAALPGPKPEKRTRLPGAEGQDPRPAGHGPGGRPV